jgi:hypothetical protein
MSISMSLVLTFQSTASLGDASVVWFVAGKSYGPFKDSTAPPPLTLLNLSAPVSVTAYVSVSCNPAASLIVYPTVDPSPQVFGQGLFLSATGTESAVTVTLSGTSACPPSAAIQVPSWATPFVTLVIVILVLATLLLIGMSMAYNYYKIKKIELYLSSGGTLTKK